MKNEPAALRCPDRQNKLPCAGPDLSSQRTFQAHSESAKTVVATHVAMNSSCDVAMAGHPPFEP